jgi:hypothetical protein
MATHEINPMHNLIGNSLIERGIIGQNRVIKYGIRKIVIDTEG